MTTAALVIPAWNEPESIAAVLDEVPPGSVQQVFVVVRDADDPTVSAARARDARTLVQARPGYGAACWTGSQAAIAAGVDVIAYLDGDYADPPAELPRVLEPLLDGRADLVLGCRRLGRDRRELPIHARAGNQLVRLLLRQAVGRSFRDLPSFKAVRADALGRLEMREMTYGWTVEMLLKSARAGLRIEEVEVPYRARLAGRSKVSGTVRGSIGAAWKLLGCVVAYAAWRPAAGPRLSIASGQ
jgi:glycosyltransferase involved in cell wall biosynthesis